jgi:prophage antirepressor-like protein
MSNLLTIKNVRGFIDESGTAQLHLGDVSTGLGFTQEKNGTLYVKWERVFGYLEDFKFPTSGETNKDEFIPENIFYRLAMKAKNETAEKFQAIVADEILPAIRKTGTYTAKPMTQAQILAAIAQQSADQEQKLIELSSRTETVERNITFIKDTIVERKDNWREWANDQIKAAAKARGNEYTQTYSEGYKLLESRANCNLNTRVKKQRDRLEKAGATKTKINSYRRIDAVEDEPRLREIFTSIIKEMAIKHAI